MPQFAPHIDALEAHGVATMADLAPLCNAGAQAVRDLDGLGLDKVTAFRLIAEACWRQEPSRRPAFGELARIDFAGIGRGSAQAVRQCRALLWPEGPPGVWAGAELDAETSRVPSCESFCLESFGAQ